MWSPTNSLTTEESWRRWKLTLNEPSTPRHMVDDPQSHLWSLCEQYMDHQSTFVLAAKQMPISWRGELVQNSLITVHRRLPSFRYLSSFTSWIEGIMRKKAKEIFRERIHVGSWAKALWNALPDEHTKGMPLAASPEDAYLVHEKLKIVERFIQEFCDGQRSVARTAIILDLALFEGQNVKEIAATTRVTVTSVNRTIRLAREFLHTKIHEEDALERIPSPLNEEEE